MQYQQDLWIVIPALNEYETLAELVPELGALGFNNIVIVDDGSTDQLQQISAIESAEVVHHCCTLGAWQAVRTGSLFAKNAGARRLVTLDGDGQHRPQDVIKLMTALDDGDFDLVIGVDGSRGSLARRVAKFLLVKLSGQNFSDVTSGFRAYGQRAIEATCAQQPLEFLHQDLGVLLSFLHKGLFVGEAEVKIHSRRRGESKIFNSALKKIEYFVHAILIILIYRFKKRG